MLFPNEDEYLSDTIQNSRLPSITEEFIGRKNELKECGKLLQERTTLFISGVAGIGKSEFAKYYADKNRKKYTNIIYLYYAGDLKKSIAGMEAEELLYELQTCGLSISFGEAVELYKDGDYTDGLMAEHLRKLLQLGKLSDPCLDVLRNFSLLSASGVLKNAFKNWLKLPSLNDVNYLAKYGFIHDDKENRKISLHPLVREIVAMETLPSVSNCHTLLDSLHCICLVHGLEVKRPQYVIDSLISITENILADIQEDYLLFLQDMFPYLEKYLVTDYLPKLTERIEYIMKFDDNNPQNESELQQDKRFRCDKALLLDYKAELFLIKNDYKNALKKRLKAVSVLEPYHTEEADQRTANLLSNLYNNLSNVYLLMKKPKETAEMLHIALTIRQEYAHLGLVESHDMLQQLINLTNMLILSKNTDMAK